MAELEGILGGVFVGYANSDVNESPLATATDSDPPIPMFVHEESYKGRGLIPHIHRRRLDLLFEVLEGIGPVEGGVVGDFGCSNGYILSLILEREPLGSEVSYFGFDHSDELLTLARESSDKAIRYHRFDLNGEDEEWRDRFDVVLCLETIEHTGDYRAAVANLYRACRPGGTIVISVPNEKGVPGLLKFFPLRVLRRELYRDFFREGKSELAYLRRLALNRRIDGFRQPPRDDWASHLGFDWRAFTEFIDDDYVRPGKLTWVERTSNFIGFNLFFVLRKA